MVPLPLVSCARTLAGSGVLGGGHRDVLQHVFVADEARGVGVDRAAGGVVPMRVAIDDVLDGDVETLVQLGFEPGGHFDADGLDQDDAVGRDHERRNIIVHSRVVDILGQFADFLAF